MALGIGMGISFCLQNYALGSNYTISGSASSTGTAEITFTLTTTTSTYAGVEFGVTPDDDTWRVFDATAGTSFSIVATSLDNVVAGNRYLWVPYTNSDPLDGYSTRLYGLGGSVDVPGTPMAPQSLAAGTATSSTVPLTWSAPVYNGGSAITDYIVQYKETISGTWLTFADGTSAATGATVTGLTSSTSYDFRVAAVNVNGTGPYGDTVTATTDVAAVVSVDAVSNATLGGNNVTTRSWTHTPVGTPTAVIVGVIYYNTPATDNVTGVTYGGTAMSLVSGVTTNAVRVELWALANPSSGAQTATVNWDNQVTCECVAMTFTGSNTTTAIRTASAQTTGGISALTRSLTCTSAGGDMVVGVCQNGGSNTVAISPGGTETEHVDQALQTIGRFGLYTKQASGSSTAITFSTASNAGYNFVAASVQIP